MAQFEILKRLRAIDVNDMLNVILKQLEPQIVAMNTDDQLFGKGITIKGAKIVPKYAESTIKRKRRLGQPTDRVTTRDKGGYHKSFKVVYGQREFFIDAEVETSRGFDLAGHLETHYNGLQGLTEENITRLTELIKPQLIALIKQKL